MVSYFYTIAISFNYFVNAVFGGNMNETISVRSGKARLKGKSWGCILCKLMDFFHREHCRKVMWHLREDVLSPENMHISDFLKLLLP